MFIVMVVLLILVVISVHHYRNRYCSSSCPSKSTTRGHLATVQPNIHTGIDLSSGFGLVPEVVSSPLEGSILTLQNDSTRLEKRCPLEGFHLVMSLP